MPMLRVRSSVYSRLGEFGEFRFGSGGSCHIDSSDKKNAPSSACFRGVLNVLAYQRKCAKALLACAIL